MSLYHVLKINEFPVSRLKIYLPTTFLDVGHMFGLIVFKDGRTDITVLALNKKIVFTRR